MDNDKKLWLEDIGAKAFPEPVKYVYTFPGYHGWFNLSEKYINETSLEELRETYKRNEKYVWSLLHSKDDRMLSAKMLDVFKKTFGFKIFKKKRKKKKAASGGKQSFSYQPSVICSGSIRQSDDVIKKHEQIFKERFNALIGR